MLFPLGFSFDSFLVTIDDIYFELFREVLTDFSGLVMNGNFFWDSAEQPRLEIVVDIDF